MLTALHLTAAASSGFHIGTRYYLIAGVVVVAVAAVIYFVRKRNTKKD